MRKIVMLMLLACFAFASGVSAFNHKENAPPKQHGFTICKTDDVQMLSVFEVPASVQLVVSWQVSPAAVYHPPKVAKTCSVCLNNGRPPNWIQANYS